MGNGSKVYINGPCHMTKMADMPNVVKLLKIFLLQKQKSYDLETWHVAGSQGELIVNLGPASVVVVVVNNVHTSSPLKPLGKSKPNFMWGSLGRGKESLYKRSMSHDKMTAMYINGKTLTIYLLQKRNSYDHETWHVASGTQVLQSSTK